MYVYLDNSSFNEFWRSSIAARQLTRMRRRLRSPLYARRPTLVLGGPLLDEMAPTRGQDLFRKKLEFLGELPVFRIALGNLDRIKLEIGDALQGTTSEMFIATEDNRTVLDAVKDDEFATASIRQMKEKKAIFGRWEHEARSGLTGKVGTQKEVARLTREWFKNPAAVVEEWARDEMRRRARQFGLPRKEAAWPVPQDVPTMWHMMAYKCARIFLVHRDGRAIDENDYPDWEHYWSAAHCDALVVNDRGFREVAELCPPPKPRLLSFEEWCSELTA